MHKFELPQSILEKTPDIHPTVFVAPSADVMGNVRIGKDSSIWYQCVLRGDINHIEIGERTNIQDSTVIHLENDIPCTIGNDVTVGHRALLHACTIEDGCLIGMGAIILNGAVIKRGSVVGAGAVVTEHMVVPENTLVVGIPAKPIKQLPATIYDDNCSWARKYVLLAGIHAQKLI